MSRILIGIRSGVETGLKTGLRRHSSTFADLSWLKPGWEVEKQGAWGVVVRGPVPASIDELVEPEADMAPMVFRVLKVGERPSIQGDRMRVVAPVGGA